MIRLISTPTGHATFEEGGFNPKSRHGRAIIVCDANGDRKRGRIISSAANGVHVEIPFDVGDYAVFCDYTKSDNRKYTKVIIVRAGIDSDGAFTVQTIADHEAHPREVHHWIESVHRGLVRPVMHAIAKASSPYCRVPHYTRGGRPPILVRLRKTAELMPCSVCRGKPAVGDYALVCEEEFTHFLCARREIRMSAVCRLVRHLAGVFQKKYGYPWPLQDVTDATIGRIDDIRIENDGDMPMMITPWEFAYIYSFHRDGITEIENASFVNVTGIDRYITFDTGEHIIGFSRIASRETDSDWYYLYPASWGRDDVENYALRARNRLIDMPVVS